MSEKRNPVGPMHRADSSDPQRGATVHVRTVAEVEQHDTVPAAPGDDHPHPLEGLRAAELEAVFEAAPGRVTIFDREGTIVRFNRAAERQAGAPRGGERLSDVQTAYGLRTLEGEPFPPDQLPVARALRGEVVTGVEMRTRGPDGEEQFMMASAAPIVDASGEVQGAVAIALDITPLRMAEREAAAHASQLEAVFDSITDAVFVYDREGQLIHANDAARALDSRLRDPRYLDHVYSQRLASLQMRDEHGHVLRPEQVPAGRVLAGEVLTGPHAVDTWIRMADGRELLLNTTGAPVRGPDGSVVGAVIVSRDVTERRALERRTREALDALLTMARAAVSIPVTPHQGAAPSTLAARELTELARQVIGANKAAIVSVDAAERVEPIAVAGVSEQEEEQWKATLRGMPLAMYLDAELSSRLRAGEVLVIDVTPSPRREAALGASSALIAPMRIGDRLTGTLSLDAGKALDAYTGEDRAFAAAVAQLAALVVERDRLLSERTAAQAQVLALTETNRLMNEFLGIAGHELRTPLTSTKANAQLALREIERMHSSALPSDVTASVRRLHPLLVRIERQATRQERLINDLLDVSRIEAGKLELNPEPADLVSIVREAVEEQRLLHVGRAISLQTPPEGTPRIVIADVDRIGQVVANYLGNALKYSAAGQPVAVTVAREADVARVSVRDYGPGLAPEERERIWERFYRVAAVERISGSSVGLGLGLYICKTIIMRHGGRVGVESEPGQGATFWFTLPLADLGDPS